MYKTSNISTVKAMKTKFILLAISVACFVASCGGSSSKKATENTDAQPVQAAEKTPIPENLSDEPVVEFQTTMGNVKVKLYKDTPLHRDNIIKLVSEGFYNGVLFHRVIEGFMVQAGDPESINAPAEKKLGSGGPGYRIPAEILPNHYHKKGALAAARTNNPEKESSGSQFYIVQGQVWDDAGLSAMQERTGIKYSDEELNTYKTVGGTPQLDGSYTVFGEVVEGLDVVDAIAAVATGEGDRPVSDVKIIKAVIVE